MPKHIKPFLRAKILSFSYFFEYYSMCFLTRFLTHLLFSQKFCFRNSVVQFSRIDARKVISLRQLCYYITPKPLCQPLFPNFFQVFLIFLIFFFWKGFLFCFLCVIMNIGNRNCAAGRCFDVKSLIWRQIFEENVQPFLIYRRKFAIFIAMM